MTGSLRPMYPKPKKEARKPKRYTKGRSAKGKARSKLYRLAIRPAYLAGLAAGQGRRGDHALCERCGNTANEVHHVAGRSGHALTDPLNLALLCKSCHDFCHDQPEKAREEGWVKSRHAYHAAKGGEESPPQPTDA